MNTPTPTIQEVIKLLDHDNPRHAPLISALQSAEKPVPSKTMRDWFQRHHGQVVDTVQYQPNGGLWCPLGRKIDAVRRKTSVSLNNSYREYAGCTVLHSDDSTLFIRLTFGHGVGWALYTVVPSEWEEAS